MYHWFSVWRKYHIRIYTMASISKERTARHILIPHYIISIPEEELCSWEVSAPSLSRLNLTNESSSEHLLLYFSLESSALSRICIYLRIIPPLAWKGRSGLRWIYNSYSSWCWLIIKLFLVIFIRPSRRSHQNLFTFPLVTTFSPNKSTHKFSCNFRIFSKNRTG